jgi:thiamine-monophosphate kinase
MRLRELGEFGLIDRIARAAARRGGAASVVLGIGDDAAILRLRAGEQIAVSTDACFEGVHFRLRNESPRTLGRRALVANLSDLAAMGARPLGCVLALAAPPGLLVRTVDALVAGLLDAAARYACPLVGGNLSRASELSLTLTVIGAVARGRALRRTAARAGDSVFVTGTLGGAALERIRAERGRGRVRSVPVPRLRAGRALAAFPGRVACIDISDGLDADLAHLLEGRALAAEIDAAQLPVPPGFRAACARAGLDPEALARGGGEDYELLFTLERGAASSAQLSRRLGVRVTEIGRLVRRAAGGRAPAGRGWRHFESLRPPKFLA